MNENMYNIVTFQFHNKLIVVFHDALPLKTNHDVICMCMSAIWGVDMAPPTPFPYEGKKVPPDS